MTLETALARAMLLEKDHDRLEERLFQLAILAKQTDLTEGDAEERQMLRQMHDVLEHEVIDAYADLHLIDPETCKRLREGDLP